MKGKYHFKDPVDCPLCHNRLNRFDSLKKHLRTQHPDYIKFVQEEFNEKTIQAAIDLINDRINLGDTEDLFFHRFMDPTPENSIIPSNGKFYVLL